MKDRDSYIALSLFKYCDGLRSVTHYYRNLRNSKFDIVNRKQLVK